MKNIKLNPKIQPSIVSIGIAGFICIIIGIVALYFKTYTLLMPCVVIIGIVATYPFYLKKTEYIIKNDKIVKNRNIFGEVHEEVRFEKIQNTKIKRGLIQKIMGGYGTVSVSTAGSNMSALKLVSIENAREIHNMISSRADRSYGNGSNREQVSNMEKTDDKRQLYAEYKKLKETSDNLKKQIKGDKI